jgi:beta-phosphoglucomutase
VVEDSRVGVCAALAGGFKVVGLGPRSRVGEAPLVLRALSEATLADLLPAGNGARGTP